MTEKEKVLEKALQEYNDFYRDHKISFVVKEISTADGDENKPVWAKVQIDGLDAILIIGDPVTTDHISQAIEEKGGKQV